MVDPSSNYPQLLMPTLWPWSSSTPIWPLPVACSPPCWPLAVPLTQDYSLLSSDKEKTWTLVHQYGAQILGIASILAWVLITSLAVWSVIKLLMGIRVSPEQEYVGVDQAECGVEAYPEFVKS